MNMPLKTDLVNAELPAPPAATTQSVVVTLSPKKPSLRSKIGPAAVAVLVRVLPPLIVLSLLLAIWELLCNQMRRQEKISKIRSL